MRCKIRIYTPVGELIPGMAYLIRRLLEITSEDSFLQKSFSEEAPFEHLIHAPRSFIGVDGEKPLTDTFKNEPPIDFSREGSRVAMREALKKVRNDLGKRYPLAIGDEQIWTDKGKGSVNPASPIELVGWVSSAGKEEVGLAVETAREAWKTWRATPPRERARCLFRAAEEFRRRRFELMALEVYEVGKSWKEADGDIAEAVDYLEYYGREMI